MTALVIVGAFAIFGAYVASILIRAVMWSRSWK
jgi:hypothetical protein